MRQVPRDLARNLSRRPCSFASSWSGTQPAVSSRCRRWISTAMRPRSMSSTSTSSSQSGMSIMDLPMPEYRNVAIAKEDPEAILNDMPSLTVQQTAKDGEQSSAKLPILSIDEPFPGIDESMAAKYGGVNLINGDNPAPQFAKLENGVRVVSVDRQGICSSLGLVVHAGSRYMPVQTAAVPHMMELMAFRSSDHLNQMQTLKTLEQLGAAATCKVGREEISYQVDVLREYVPVALPLMLANVLCPKFLPEEVEVAKEAALQQHHLIMDGGNSEGLLVDWLHSTAFGGGTLGAPLYATEKDMDLFTPETLRSFVAEHCHPSRLIVVGVNTDCEELCKWTARCFADYSPPPTSVQKPGPPERSPAVYLGGEYSGHGPQPLCDMLLGWEIEGGWSSNALGAATVLQMFLGGGGSFSTGGPGKGMHTRIFTDVLNKYGWVESCHASSMMYADCGLFAVQATVRPQNAGDFVTVLANVFKGLSRTPTEEVQRAKNALKSSVHMNLETRALLMEDIGRQLVLADRVGTATDFARMVDLVTADDMKAVLRHCLSKKPTLVAHGNIGSLPRFEKVEQQMRAAAP